MMSLTFQIVSTVTASLCFSYLLTAASRYTLVIAVELKIVISLLLL